MKYTEQDREVQEFKLERDLQKYVMTRLKAIKGLKSFNIHGDMYNVGIPDIIGCYNGRFFGIELKVKKNKPTKLQQQHLDEIVQAGGVAGVAWTWGDVKNILKKAGISIDTM